MTIPETQLIGPRLPSRSGEARSARQRLEQFRDAAGPVLELAVLVALLLGHRILEYGREQERPPAVDEATDPPTCSWARVE